jgi:hypothetical protein
LKRLLGAQRAESTTCYMCVVLWLGPTFPAKLFRSCIVKGCVGWVLGEVYILAKVARMLHSGVSVFCITVGLWARICGGECPVYSKILNDSFRARVLQLQPHQK